jgi:N-methylhydantoinase A
MLNIPRSPATILGVDIGGTFTDFLLLRDGQIELHKRLTTPDDPSRAMLAGIDHLHLPPDAEVVHGSTIATNALLERRGARTALITTRGFADVIEIGRQDRPNLYALLPRKPKPLVPPELRFEVDERVAADGSILVPLDPSTFLSLVQQILDADAESVAVCLLFSFLDPSHEQIIGAALRDHLPVTLSSDLLPEYREYERTSTTVINAYVAPLMASYLEKLEAGLGSRHLLIMQSSGGVISSESARREAARTVLSGPAGGAVGAFHVAQHAGFDHIISFDMGGTSTDVALFPGYMMRTREAKIAGLPMRLPVVDIHTVGAGGGSIARVDAGGALRVGPDSAGADPGPACYGRGDLPTTSDANLVLGRLHPDHFLGGQMPLYPDRAADALSRLAASLHLDRPEHAAWGVIQIANATMERAIRAISVERGFDPRDFTLVPFGGAGPLHACALAESLLIPRILVPLTPGVLSALGMAIADRVRDYSQSILARADVLNRADLATIFAGLADQGRADLLAEGTAPGDIVLERSLDMRYVGQSHEITVLEPPDAEWIAAFHSAHDLRYGHRHDDEPVEIVSARLKAVGRGHPPELHPLPDAGPDPSVAHIGQGQAWFSPDEPVLVDYYHRDKLGAGNRVVGPAIIFQLDTTTVLPPGWRAQVDAWGNLLLSQ